MTDPGEAARIVDRNAATASPLADHPQLRRYIECFLETFILSGRVDPRLRELTILRIAWRCGQPFEWAQHYRRARQDGVTDAEILAIRTLDVERDLDGPVRVVVQAADEVVDDGRISSATFEACGQVFADPAVWYEFLHLAAGYRMMATVLNTTQPSVADAGLPEWPPDGVGPSA